MQPINYLFPNQIASSSIIEASLGYSPSSIQFAVDTKTSGQCIVCEVIEAAGKDKVPGDISIVIN
jgi:hypothetical protein